MKLYIINALNPFFEMIDRVLDKITSPIYYWFLIMIYFLYFATFLGILYVNKSYIHNLSVFMQTFIAIILIIRFNPLRKHNLRESDNTLIFGSALFLLINVGLTERFSNYVHKMWDNNIKPNINNIFINSVPVSTPTHI